MPLPSTMTPIATNTLTAAAASVTFSNLPQTYTDLVLVTSTSITTSAAQLRIQLNSDTGTNYSSTYLYGSGTTATSTRDSNRTQLDLAGSVGSNGSTFSPNTIHFMNYSNTTTYKTVIGRAVYGATNLLDYVQAAVSLWRSTAAITTMTFSPNAGSWTAGSSFTLYGVKAA